MKMTFNKFKPGDRVRVQDLVWSPKHYPFLPNLIGMVGSILEETYPEDPDGANGPEPAIYKVKFDQKFRSGKVPPGISAFGYEPDEWEEGDEYALTGEELVPYEEAKESARTPTGVPTDEPSAVEA